MDPATINSNTFTLMLGSALVPGKIAYSDKTKTATFTSTNDMSVATLYKIVITGVKDLAGNAIANPYNWRFITGFGKYPR